MTPVREPLEFVQEDKEEDLAMPPVKELLSVRSPLAVPGSSLLDARAVSMKFDRRCVFLEEAALEFNDVVFVAGSGKKKSVIVKKVGTKVSHGHVLAIMGPSGAGKTTLISILTQDAFYGNAYGTVTLNGVPMSETIFKRHCYVVRQQDANWPYLTARETLMFAAELYKVTEDMESTVLLVDELMCKMGLVSCKDTKCCRLSGGQQRRLSLAVALLKQPSVLFLDEPTSGLDACSASMIMKKISRVAKRENLIIICTIHQPSTKVFEGFDRLMILSKGREAFVGDAKQAVNHFRSIGYPLPQQTNPAEHFLDICNADFSSNAEVDKILDSWAHQKVTSSLLKHEYVALPDLNDDRQPTLKHQTRVMFRRHLKLILRDPVLYAGRVLACLVVNSIFGIVYIAARNYDQDQAINKLWVSGWYIGVPANMAVVAVYKLNQELRSILLENKNGLASISSYLIAKTILVIPILFLFAFAAIGIPGFVIQNYPPSTFGPLLLLWTVQITVWESSAEAIAGLFDDAVIGMLLHTGLWLAALLFSGYLVPLGDMFWPLKLFYYVLPYNYYVRSATFLIFTEEEWVPCVDPRSSAVCVDSTSGLAVLGDLERIFPLLSTEDTYWPDLGAMLALGIAWKILAIVAIRLRSRRVAKIRGPGELGNLDILMSSDKDNKNQEQAVAETGKEDIEQGVLSLKVEQDYNTMEVMQEDADEELEEEKIEEETEIAEDGAEIEEGEKESALEIPCGHGDGDDSF